MVLAPEHPLVDAFTTRTSSAEVEAYRKAAASKDLVSRKVGEREKTGVFTGGYAVNPATGKPIPVWIADYVLMEYGTGAIMAVPGHDERDFEFAKKFELPIVRVVASTDAPPRRHPERSEGPRSADADLAAYADNEHGILVNSGQFDGLPVPEAKRARSPPGSSRAAPARASSSTASTTGASPASATGARRSRSSTATSTARCRCRRRTCRSSCR